MKSIARPSVHALPLVGARVTSVPARPIYLQSGSSGSTKRDLKGVTNRNSQRVFSSAISTEKEPEGNNNEPEEFWEVCWF